MKFRPAAIAAIIVLCAGSLILAPTAASASTPTTGGKSSTAGRPYPGDPDKEASIVSSESQRIYDLKAITAAARWRGLITTYPYEVTLGSIPTLVLVARSRPYTVADLEQLIPSGFVKQPGGAYLLSDDIVAETGAVLSLSNPDGMDIRLASSSDSFVSIVAAGGSLVIEGSAKSPVSVESWNSSVGAVDNSTSDGRAYIRVIGGSAKFTYANFNHLGFWSGGTGGVSLTGTEISASDVGKSTTTVQSTPPDTSESTTVHGANVQNLGPESSIGDIASQVTDSGNSYSYVSANISHVKIDADAYGLYVNGSNGVNIANSSVMNSLIDGIVFHRFVTNSTVSSTSSNGNAVDGFAMTRASTGVILTGLTTNDNGRDGTSLNGSPLASGPNAAGVAVATYGNNSLLNSTSTGNVRYGVLIEGGENIRVVGNSMANNAMGIVVSHAAKKVDISSNTIKSSSQHGISIIDQVTAASIEHNQVDDADIAIYVRDSTADVLSNTVSGATTHGVTFIGNSSGSQLDENTLVGSGPTAVDTARSTGVTVGKNPSPLWTVTKPISVILLGVFQPLTILWIVLGLILLISAISGIGKKHRGFRHPYGDQVPLASLTKGVVTAEELGLAPRVVAVALAEPNEPPAWPLRDFAWSPRSGSGRLPVGSHSAK
jgi:nitrous oxidase accessory protein NosD